MKNCSFLKVAFEAVPTFINIWRQSSDEHFSREPLGGVGVKVGRPWGSQSRKLAPRGPGSAAAPTPTLGGCKISCRAAGVVGSAATAATGTVVVALVAVVVVVSGPVAAPAAAAATLVEIWPAAAATPSIRQVVLEASHRVQWTASLQKITRNVLLHFDTNCFTLSKKRFVSR